VFNSAVEINTGWLLLDICVWNRARGRFWVADPMIVQKCVSRKLTGLVTGMRLLGSWTLHLRPRLCPPDCCF